MPSLQASPSRLKLPRSRQRAQTPVWLLPVYPACRRLQVAGRPDRKQHTAHSTQHAPFLDSITPYSTATTREAESDSRAGRFISPVTNPTSTIHPTHSLRPGCWKAGTRSPSLIVHAPLSTEAAPPTHPRLAVSPSVPHAPTCPSWVASTWVGRPPSPSAAAASCHCQIQSQSTKSWLGATPLQSRCPQAHDGTKWHADPWRCVVPVRVYDANW